MQLEDDNTNCTIYSTAFHSCSSASNGGAIRIGTNQINFVVDGCVFKGCISAKGKLMFSALCMMIRKCSYLIISAYYFYTAGGALYVFRGNLFLIMRDTFITGSGILYQTSQGGAVRYYSSIYLCLINDPCILCIFFLDPCREFFICHDR